VLGVRRPGCQILGVGRPEASGPEAGCPQRPLS